MATNVNNVTTGKPKINGAVFRAPLGTPLPTSASDALDPAFKDMGYISDGGFTNTTTRSVTDIKAWGGDIVLNPQNEKKDQLKLVFIEALNEDVMKATHGDDNVSGNLTDGMVVRENSKELDYASWVIDTILNGALKRIVAPKAKITEIGDIVYKDDTVLGYDSTITCYPSDEFEGDTHREYIKGKTPDGDDEGGGGDDPTPTLNTLTVTSEAGTDLGTTAISVSPEKAAENIYVYTLGDDEAVVSYDMDVQSWTVWDGESDIEATEDQVITVVEATADNKARGAGNATVVIR